MPGQPRYRSLALQMGAAGVRGPSPSLGAASALQRERLLGRDRKMIAAAEFLLALTIPTTNSGTKLLPLPFLGDHYLRNLFELATYGFLVTDWRPMAGTCNTENSSTGTSRISPRDGSRPAQNGARHPAQSPLTHRARDPGRS